MILLDPDVDVAILEMTVTDVVRNGLGCDAFDLSIIVDETQASHANNPNQAATGPSVTTQNDASKPIAAKTRDAIRVIAETTRTGILIRAASTIRDVVEAQTSDRQVEAVDAQPVVPDSEGILPSSEAEAPSDQVLDLAYAAARRLGVSARRAQRGIKSFASRSSRRAGKKIRSVRRDRKQKGRAKKSDTDGTGPGDEPAAVSEG
jgi:hypothetical protein